MAELATSSTTKDPRLPKGAAPPVTGKPDVAELTDDDLRSMISVAEQELAARRERKQTEFLSYVREQALALGVDRADIDAALGKKPKRPASDRRATVAPKYRDPANPAQTWSGRGAAPKWLQAQLDAGQQLECFAIQDARTGA
jgi:DNA-binding protein H-NS